MNIQEFVVQNEKDKSLRYNIGSGRIFQVNCIDEALSKIAEENFLKLKKHISIQIQKVHRTSNRQDQKNPPHLILKLKH